MKNSVIQTLKLIVKVCIGGPGVALLFLCIFLCMLLNFINGEKL